MFILFPSHKLETPDLVKQPMLIQRRVKYKPKEQIRRFVEVLTSFYLGLPLQETVVILWKVDFSFVNLLMEMKWDWAEVLIY